MSNQKTDLQDSETIVPKQSVIDKNKSNTTSRTFYGSKLFVKCFAWFIFITIINILLAGLFGYLYHYRPAKEESDRISARILQDKGQLMIETYEKQGTLSSSRLRGPGNFWLFDEKLNKLFDGSDKDWFEIKPKSNQVSNNLSKNNSIKTNAQSKQPNEKKLTIEVKSHQFQLYQLYRQKYKTLYKENESKILSFAKKLLNSKNTEVLLIEKESFFGCQLISDSNNNYIAIIHIPRELPDQRKDIFINQTKNMFPLLFIVCAVLCFLMARYLAKPIVELQEASQKFAKGDFSHKITKEAMARYDEIGDLASDFNNMASKIEALINSQKRLFNDISHELRSPLARMQVGIELLQMKVPDSEKSLVERLNRDVNRMNALIEEVLQFSKLENKQISGPSEEVNLAKALENVCADAEFESKTKHKGVRLEIKQECSIKKGNSVLLERAFENIIRNGLRFTPENSIVEVSLEKIDNKAIIKISDQGPGVPDDQIGKIFDPFYCIKADRNPQQGGIGLGLCIALKAVQIHNGTIKMSNKTQGGLLATIELPLE
ncbi:MAG: HAMP domain-containing histidine kinase [Candidatus Riflebacteria bacterium]|nr:HAMP domain-containing histidine kinase [Candidatus Riflebacteria bacterium]